MGLTIHQEPVLVVTITPQTLQDNLFQLTIHQEPVLVVTNI